MLLSPKQDELKAQIKTVILRDSEDFFFFSMNLKISLCCKIRSESHASSLIS
jgi:hypothetical protein